MNPIPKWFPEKKPIYDISKTYDENFAEGPFFNGDILKRQLPPEDEWFDFLGQKVASPIGVPAGPLLNSNWTTLAANLGFDIVTYKTIRSGDHPCHPAPNMIYLETKGRIKKEEIGTEFQEKKTEPKEMASLSVTNSFGMPSKGPDYLMEDIDKALKGVKDGQVLVVSVVGTPREGEDFVKDFVKTAAIAKEAGAKIIEANFSCPNVTSGEGSIYTDPKTVAQIGKGIVNEIGDIPLIIKVGYFMDDQNMKEVFVAAAGAGVRSISGINTLGVKVIKEDGSAVLGKDRLTSGACGEPIQDRALEYLEKAVNINDQEKLGLVLIGVGGITLPEHFDLFLNSGADAAMSATGMMWDPYLGLRYHQTKGNLS